MDNIENEELNQGEKLFKIFQTMKEDFFNDDDNEIMIKKNIDNDNDFLNKSLQDLMINNDDLNSYLKESTNEENFIQEIKKQHNDYLKELLIELNQQQNVFFYEKLIKLKKLNNK